LRHYRQAGEVLAHSAGLTDRRKAIAEYWADEPSSELPPGHWCLFAGHVSARDRNSTSEEVTMSFAMTTAIFDASIVCWGAKRSFDHIRPVSAIHHLFGGQRVLAWAGPGLGTRLIHGRDWRPCQAATVVRRRGRRRQVTVARAGAEPGPRRPSARPGTVPSMYGYNGSMKVKPGHRDEVIAILLRDVEGLRAAGCNAYVVSVVAGDEDTIWVNEVWESDAHHRASLELPETQAAIAEALPLLTGDFAAQETDVRGGLGLPANPAAPAG